MQQLFLDSFNGVTFAVAVAIALLWTGFSRGSSVFETMVRLATRVAVAWFAVAVGWVVLVHVLVIGLLGAIL